MLGLAHPGGATTRRRGVAALVALALGAWGLDADRHRADPPPAPELATPEGESAGGAPDGGALVRPRLAAVPATTTVVDATDPVALATATSALLYDEAPVVVLAPADDPAAQARAASAAVAVGGPLLLTPPDPGPTGAAPQAARAQAAAPAPTVADEADRLRPRAVLAVGAGAVRWARAEVDGADVVAVPDGADLRTGAGLTLGDDTAVAPGDLVAAVAGLDRERPALLTVEGAAAGPAGAATGQAAAVGAGEPDATVAGEGAGEEGAGRSGEPTTELPAVAPADPPDEVLAVVEAGDAAVAAVATARASGARVVPVAGGDPRADPAAIAALAGAPLPERVVVLGAGLGPAERVRPRLEVAATGTELPGGGQVLFPGRRMVALYGHPGAPVLGVLGEQPVEAAVERAREVAAGYEGLVAEPVVPAFEIITTVASASPGPDGDYSAELEVADLRPWVDAAEEAGLYVVLDLQPGRTDFLTQARRYEELLARPHVGLALDPEWRLGPDQRHLEQIGSVGVDEVNAVADWLADLTRRHRLPQKLLLLHQFQLGMITDRARLDTSHDELAVLVHADGFGTPGQKLETWHALRAEPLPGVWWGWKNFIDEDQPTFTPAETVAVQPTPWFVSYQ